jgi:multisubunit Na+/H+ antiporter MnhC subunit/uncharacterized MnhB-related membrane protein
MSIATIFEIVLAAVVLGLGIWTIVVRETYSATVGYVAYGLLVALIWVRLGAVDVALTEAAIGGGLGGVLLLGAAARLRDSEPTVADAPGKAVRVCAAILSALTAAALAGAVLVLPDPAPTLAPAAISNAWATGMANPVTNVLMAFRAMDTLLEKVVLLLAIIGVWSLAHDSAWGGRPGPRHQADPHGVLVFLARLLPPIGIVVGIYILWTATAYPHCRAGLVPCGRPCRTSVWLRIPLLSAGSRQAADPRHRGRHDPHDCGNPRPSACRRTGTEREAMSGVTVFGLCAAAAVGLGLYGLITNPQPLRKIIAFNLLGSGVFLLFGVVGRRGAADIGNDPVPQALVITGVVVAFSATALAIALLLRLFQASGSTTLSNGAPPGAGSNPSGG